MSERATIEVTTPSGVKVTLYSFLSGGEYEEIQSVINGAMTLKGSPDELSGSGGELEVPLDIQRQAEMKTIELLLVAVNDVKEGALAMLKNMPQADWHFVKAKVNEISKPDFLGQTQKS